MRGVKDFLRESVPAMVDYIVVVSTPTGDYTSYPGLVSDRHDRLNVVNYLRQRTMTMPVLDREAVPILPHLLDIPRHLAIITSAVIRNSREFQGKPHESAEKPLHDLCAKCFDVEEQALLRVSQLATKISSDRRNSPSTRTTNPHTSSSDRLPASPLSGSSTDRRRLRKSSRPSTAPSPSESNSSQRRMFGDVASASAPLVFTRAPTDSSVRAPGQLGRHLHLKSTSTDSVPTYGVGTPSAQTPVISRPHLPPVDSEDTGKRVRGLLRGILRR